MNFNRSSHKNTNSLYPFIRSISYSLFLFLFISLLSSCRKQSPGQEAPALIRLENLIEDPKTVIDSHYTVDSGEFKPYAGSGWQINSDLITAAEKRTVFLLPESLWRSRNFQMKFSARSEAPRNLTIQTQGNDLAKYQLTPEWKEYSLRFTTKDLKKRTVKHLHFLFDGDTTASYAEFRTFQMPLYFWGRTKLVQDTRAAISVSSRSSVRFQVLLPFGKPTLFFGIGVPARKINPSEITYAVTVIEKKRSKELLRKTLKFTPAQTPWSDESIRLQDYAGQEVTLELRTQSAAAENHSVAWSSPEIYNVEAKRDKPNVILFSIDTLRFDRLSDRTAPNLMSLARRSLVYQNAYCTFPSTLPSHASVMTGLYVANHQVSRPHLEIIRTKQIPPKLKTIAETARQAKYLTAGITDGGFVAGFFGFDRGFQQYSDNVHIQRTDVATIANAMQWLGRNSQRPFFLFLHSYEVHEPFNPPEDVFRKLFPKPALDQPPRITMDWLHKVVRGDIVPTEQQKEFIRQCYDAEVYFFDQNFGRLMTELKRLNLDQNTVILIFADHGEQFFDREESFGHGKTLVPEEIQVPLILHIPGRKAEQRDDLVSLVDIFPTIAEIIGIPLKVPVDGISLLEPRDSKKRFNRSIYYEVMYGKEARWGAQTREFKLVFDKQKGVEYFYDLRKDPHQKNNVASSDSHSMKMMKQLLTAYVQKSTKPTDWTKTQQEKQETGELREQLKALGYIN